MKPETFNLSPREMIKVIRKKGDVYVVSRTTEHDEHLFKVVKSNAIALFKDFDDDTLIGGQLIKNSEGKFMDLLLSW